MKHWLSILNCKQVKMHILVLVFLERVTTSCHVIKSLCPLFCSFSCINCLISVITKPKMKTDFSILQFSFCWNSMLDNLHHFRIPEPSSYKLVPITTWCKSPLLQYVSSLATGCDHCLVVLWQRSTNPLTWIFCYFSLLLKYCWNPFKMQKNWHLIS